jgi:hypothetical protein
VDAESDQRLASETRGLLLFAACHARGVFAVFAVIGLLEKLTMCRLKELSSNEP